MKKNKIPFTTTIDAEIKKKLFSLKHKGYSAGDVIEDLVNLFFEDYLKFIDKENNSNINELRENKRKEEQFLKNDDVEELIKEVLEKYLKNTDQNKKNCIDIENDDAISIDDSIFDDDI